MPRKKQLDKTTISETICGGDLPKFKSELERMEEELKALDDTLDCLEENDSDDCIKPSSKKKPAKKKSK